MSMSREMWRREQEKKRRQRERRLKRQRKCALIVFICAIVAVVAIIVLSNNKNDGKPAQTTTTEYTQAPEPDTSVARNAYTTTRTVEDLKMSFYNNCAFAGNAVADTIATYNILENTDYYSHVNADVSNVYTLTTNGSTTSIVEQFKSKKFKKVFLCFGEKELESGNSSQFRVDYEDLVQKIKEYQPNTTIYLVGIPPVTSIVSDAAVNGVSMSRINSYNKKIMSLAKSEEVYYIDSVDALGDNKGFLPQGVSYDGINLNRDAVIDLLYYGAKKAYIPTQADIDRGSEDEEKEEEEESTARPDKETEDDEDSEATQKPEKTPSPSVNVLKDSEIKKAEEE